ncbi:hypothetical protein C1N81_30955 [Streptomyces sp. SGAir0957]
MTTDPTAAIEVWARMLCAADVYVHGTDHPTWEQLGRLPGNVQEDYRKAARWLLPRLTVGQPAAPSAPSADNLRDRIAAAIAESDGVPSFKFAAKLHRAACLREADAVMAVLPVTVRRHTVLRETTTFIHNAYFEDGWSVERIVTVLRQAADAAEEADRG